MMESAKPIILIADDETTNIDILLEALGEAYEIAVAIDGESVLERVELTLPDLILLDVTMPGMDGYEVCRRLKTMQKTAQIPIIFVTAREESDEEKKGLALGAIDYITKPIHPEIVKARVQNHLALKFARQELEEQNEHLKAMLQLREDMAHMIVHDMRTPLSAILGFSQLLLVRKPNAEKVSKYIHNIRESADQLNSFLNDMLMLAKTQSEQLLLNLSPVDMRQLVTSAREMFTYIAQSREISLVEELPAQAIEISIDKKLFARVIDNLLSNALKFSPSSSKVVMRLLYTENTMRLSIIDEGPGVPEQEKRRIFDKYATVQLKREDVSQIGLGLAFCQMVVEAHGGKIGVSDNNPQGAVFTVELVR